MEYPHHRSPWEAYPYLAEQASDLRCDYEMETDEISSYIGLLLAQLRDLSLPADANVVDELHWINELVYHLNPSLRMGVKITIEERDKLLKLTEAMQARSGGQGFVLPEGSEAAALAHIVRCKCKKLVRLTYRHLEGAGRGELTQEALEILVDVPNLLSGYFFGFALTLNRLVNVPETPFISRHYF